MVGLRHELRRLRVHDVLVCHLLVPSLPSGQRAEHELCMSHLGRSDHFCGGLVVHWSSQELRGPYNDWRHIGGGADSTRERGNEEGISLSIFDDCVDIGVMLVAICDQQKEILRNVFHALVLKHKPSNGNLLRSLSNSYIIGAAVNDLLAVLNYCIISHVANS